MQPSWDVFAALGHLHSFSNTIQQMFYNRYTVHNMAK